MRCAVSPLAFAAMFGLCACTVAPPPGPSVMALPGQGKDFETFQQDDMACRQYAAHQTGGASPAVAASQSAVGSAVLSTALGAAAGAAVGSVGGAAGAGAAIGGATGLVAGSAIGANNAAIAAGSVQEAYDVNYTQCMYSKGDTVQPPPGSYPYPADGYSSPYFPYPYPYAYGYGPAFFGPSFAVGVFGGWHGGGWHGGGWHGGGWHGGGWHGGGWHGGGWHGGGGHGGSR